MNSFINLIFSAFQVLQSSERELVNTLIGLFNIHKTLVIGIIISALQMRRGSKLALVPHLLLGRSGFEPLQDSKAMLLPPPQSTSGADCKCGELRNKQHRTLKYLEERVKILFSENSKLQSS